MGKRYLIDTNAVSKSLTGLFSANGLSLVVASIDDEANYSIITRIELLSYVPASVEVQAAINTFLDYGNEFGLTEDIIQQTILIRRNARIKLPDAIIAATAIVYGLTLLSDNDSDFLRVPRLKYINPAKL